MRSRLPSSPVLLWVTVVLVVLLVLGIARSRGDADSIVRGADQDLPGPVLLVPGYGGGTGALEVLAGKLRASGRSATVVALPGDGTGDLRDAARVLDAAVAAELSAGAPSVDIVGYSAGGVTARYWVRQFGGASKARRVVTLGSPHHGTRVAALGARFAAGACPVACQQLVPDSDLLDELNDGDETPAGPQWLSVWTDQDETVTPAESARLQGAVDVVLQRVCPGLAVSHADLPRAPLVTGIVLQALAATPIPTPRSADCAFLLEQGS